MQGIQRTIRKRRLEGRTDYKARLYLLKSGKPRVIFRKTNRYLLAQIVVSEIAQDKVLVNVTTKDLIKYGWPEKLSGSLKSLPAAYLMGYLLVKKSKNIKEGVLDIGLLTHVPKSRIYAFVKGLKDAGFDIPCNDDVLPTEDLINKKKETAKLINQLKEKII
ncbi:50S ribosomal protein L18 [Candidatus Pacearchaeota archaeon]|nr:50S ribosomal protein L18 [Candidatus Pacearchaeota archaeon]